MSGKRRSKLRLWRTKSGVLVEQQGPTCRGASSGEIRIFAFRYPTGGYHGLLHVKNLRRVDRAVPGSTNGT